MSFCSFHHSILTFLVLKAIHFFKTAYTPKRKATKISNVANYKKALSIKTIIVIEEGPIDFEYNIHQERWSSNLKKTNLKQRPLR